jgi:AraC-like DNA-binding protein
MRADFEHVATPPELSWAYREFRQTAFDFSWHLHTELELTLITHGTGTRIVGTSIESYRPRDLALIGPEVPHAYVSTPGTSRHEAIVVQFRRDFLGAEFVARPEFIALGRLFDAASGAIVFNATSTTVAEMRALADLAPADRTLALVRLLMSLAGEAETRSITVVESRLAALSQPARRRADAVCAYLQSSYAGPVSLAEVAAVAHMSPPALSRFFRHAIGRTITEYVTELRIAAACQLLSDSDVPIATIATQCGYDNLSNFNRRFRAVKGMTPRQYRGVMAGVPMHAMQQ